jgi:hypothetical protein
MLWPEAELGTHLEGTCQQVVGSPGRQNFIFPKSQSKTSDTLRTFHQRSCSRLVIMHR